jgi:hypothetical protein
VGAVAGARALQAEGDREVPARGDEGLHVSLPVALVEVGGEEPAGLVFEKRVDARDQLALQVIPDDLIGHRQERLVRTLAAFHARLLADAADPLVRARGGVALRPLLEVLPALGEHVHTPAEQTAKKCDLLGRSPGRHWCQRGRHAANELSVPAQALLDEGTLALQFCEAFLVLADGSLEGHVFQWQIFRVWHGAMRAIGAAPSVRSRNGGETASVKA